ncbi:MAG TPA: hypothetical protein VGJ26_09595 [Pirellulales bacterium]|jgi:hypothetical protein
MRREVELSERFDIYFVLLGLPAGPRPPDYYTLLGLPPLTDSTRQINAAVERQMAKLTPLLLSPQGRKAQRMIGEVLEARDVLSSARRKKEYDAKLLDGNFEPDANAETREIEVPKDANPVDVVSAASATPVDSFKAAAVGPRSSPVDVRAMLPPPACEPIAPPLAPPIQAAQAPATGASPLPPFSESPARPLAPASKDVSLSEMSLNWLQPIFPTAEPVADLIAPSPQRPMTTPNISLDVEAIPSAIPVDEFTPYDAQGDSDFATPLPAAHGDWPSPSGLGVTAGAVRAVSLPGARSQDASQFIMLTVMAAMVAGVVLVACVALIANQRQNARTTEVSQAAPTSPAAGSPIAGHSNRSTPAAKRTEFRPAAPRTTVSHETKPISMPTSSNPSATSAPNSAPLPPEEPAQPAPARSAPPAEPEPTPPPTSPPPDPKPDPVTSAGAKQVAVVREALAEARTALSKRDIVGAAKGLDLALVEASTPELLAEVENAKTLHHYVDGFWGAVRERIQGMKGGEELPIGKRLVNVVERRGDRLIIHDSGRSHTYGAHDMPADYAEALADSWLKKDNPNRAVFIGVFWAVDAKGDAKRGRQILEEAKKAGSTAASDVLEALAPVK